MTARQAIVAAAIAVTVAVTGTAVYLLMLRSSRLASMTARAAPAVTTPAAPGRKIKVRLFYVADDGTRLTGVEREVPLAEGAEQAREIIAVQIAPVTEPLLSAVPPG